MANTGTSSTARSTESKTLLDTCTPLVYVNNAFRITGLPVDATARDIKRRIDELKNAEELGLAAGEHTHAFALDPPPSVEAIRQAAQQLQDPERRIVEEFFWFWPAEWGKSKDDPPLLALMRGDKDTAFREWSRVLASSRAQSHAVAKHNLAVMYHLVALDSEHYALEGDLDPDQHQAIMKYWLTCFKWWEELTDDEAFWSLVTDRIRMLDDPRVTTGQARRMRFTFPQALDKINAMLAIKFAERDKLSLAANHIGYMKATHQGKDDIAKTLDSVTKPLKTRARDAIDRAENTASRQPAASAQAAQELLQAVAEPMRIIQMILPQGDHERIDLCDAIADACLQCQIAYARETEDWAQSLTILDAAVEYATSPDIKKHVADNRGIVARNRLFSQYLGPLTAAIKKADAREMFPNKLQAVRTDVIPLLKKAESVPNMPAEVYEICSDNVAGYLRSLSVDAFNKANDITTSRHAHELAKSIAKGAELRKLLKEDAVRLNDIELNARFNNYAESAPWTLASLQSLQIMIFQTAQAEQNASNSDKILSAGAHALRNLAIRMCNLGNKYKLGQQAILSALQVANRMKERDAQLVEQLTDDLRTVTSNRQIKRANTIRSIFNFFGVLLLAILGPLGFSALRGSLVGS